MSLQEISKNQVHVSKSFLDNSILIKGDLNFSDTLEIQGSVVGNIFSDSSSISFLIIGKNSEITGDIVSSHVFVSGKVIGNISANHIEIEETARIIGSVNYKSIEVHSGAKIDGSMTTSDRDFKVISNSNQRISFNHEQTDNASNQSPSSISLTKIPSSRIEVPA